LWDVVVSAAHPLYTHLYVARVTKRDCLTLGCEQRRL